MHSQSFNPKRYAFTVFMSINLLAGSFLSTEARAASFADLASKTSVLKKYEAKEQTNIWNNFTPNEKIKKWKEVNLVPSEDQAKKDLGIKSSLIPNKHNDRLQRAQIQLYLKKIEQQDYHKNFDEYVNQGKIPNDQETAAILNLQYDASLINDPDATIRCPQKDRKAIIDLYKNSIKREIDYKNYVDNNIIPKTDEVKTDLNMSKVEAESFISSVRTGIMDKAKAQYIDGNHIPQEEELKNKFEADKNEATDYIKSIATQLMIKEKAQYIEDGIVPEVKELKEKFSIGKIKANSYIEQIKAGIEAKKRLNKDNNSESSVKHSQRKKRNTDNWYTSNQDTNTTGASSQIPINTVREKQKTSTFDFRKRIIDHITKKKTEELSIIESIIEQNLKRNKVRKEFEEFLTDNKPIEALEFAQKSKLEDIYKEQAVNAINFDNDDLVKKIVFTIDEAAKTNEFAKTKPILNWVLTNSSPEKKAEIIGKIKEYAIRNVSKGKFSKKDQLDLIKLAVSKEREPVAKLVTLQLELNNKIQPYFVRGTYNLTPKIVKEINEDLQNKELITDNLTKEDIVRLAKEANKYTLESVMKLILSDNDILDNEVNKILELTVSNNSNNLNQRQGGIPNLPPPPPPPSGSILMPPPPLFQGFNGNSNNLNLDQLKEKYPNIASLYDQFTRNNAARPKGQFATPNVIVAERSTPETADAKLYIEYRAETSSDKAFDLHNQKIKKQDDITNVIRQIVTKFYNDQGAETETLITLFSQSTPKIKKKANEVFNTLAQDPYIQDIITDGNKTKIITKTAILDDLFSESEQEAKKRLLLPSSQINEQHRKEIRDQNIIEVKTEFENKRNPFDKLRYAYENRNQLEEGAFKNTLDTLIADPKILDYKDRINFLTQGNQKLNELMEKKIVDIDQESAIKASILNTLEIKDLVNLVIGDVESSVTLPVIKFLDIIKQNKPELLKEFLEAKITSEENKFNNLDNKVTLIREFVPSLNDLTDQELIALIDIISIDRLKVALKNKWEQEIKTTASNTQKPPVYNNGISNPPPPPPPPSFNGGIPMPPPIPNGNSNFEANDYLLRNGISPDLIDRINNLPKTKSNTTNTSIKEFNFKSDIGKKYYEASIAKGDMIILTQMQRLDRIIKEEVLAQYLNNMDQKLKEFDPSQWQEAFDTAHPGFIGPRTELGQEVHIKLFSDAVVQEAFDTAHPGFIGPRTELGQKVNELYEQNLLELLNDKGFVNYIQNAPVAKELVPFINELDKNRPKLKEILNGSGYISDMEEEEVAATRAEKERKKTESLRYMGSEAAEKDREAEEQRQRQEAEARVEKEREESESLRYMGSETAEKDREAEEQRQRQEAEARVEKEREESESLRYMGSETAEKDREAEVKRKEEESKLPVEAEAKTESESKELEEHKDKEEILSQSYESEKKVEEANKARDAAIASKLLEEQRDLEIKEQVREKTNTVVALLNNMSSKLKKLISNIFNNRMIVSVLGAGDEDVTVTRGVWVSGLYGTSSQGAWKNIPKYKGRTAGVTIGMDAEFSDSSDIIGIAYSRIESHFKYNKKLGKTALNGHLISAYGLKELPKNFSLQGIASFDHNYIKNKTKNANNIVGKYKNNNFNFETLLSYKYRTKYDLYLIPSIGLKYDYSRNGYYKESGNIQNLMIEKKSNQLLESSFGSKIVFSPLRVSNDIAITPSVHGNIENHFYNKNSKVKARATFKDQVIEEIINLPKQPRVGYNIGGNIVLSRRNIKVLLEHNYYTHKKYQSHQSLIKLKVGL
ncbi:MAG: autotransporter domain-containing protein [Rickettsia endosymbiont of Pentastiridius leporinus]